LEDASSSSSSCGSEDGCGTDCSHLNAHHTHQQQQQHLQQELSGDLAALAAAVSSSLTAADALTAAQRQARWQQLGRIKAEAAAEALRGSCTRLKARLRAARTEAEGSRQAAQRGTTAAAELPKLQGELAAAREALRAVRAEQQRHLQQQRAALTTIAATVGAAGASPEMSAALAAAAAAAAASSAGSSNRGATAAPGPDYLSVLQLLERLLREQQSGKEVLQARLAESKAALERKNTLIRWAVIRPQCLACSTPAAVRAAPCCNASWSSSRSWAAT
jgi:hypothetical protein